ncbi:Copia protein, partial [Glycine soja]
LTLPLFDGKSYHLWAFRMEAYLEAGDLWEAVEDVYEVEPLPDNPTVAQIKNHKERKQRKSLIGCLMYLSASRPDILHAVSLLSRYMNCASRIHFQAAKRILRYVKGTIDFGIRYHYVKNFRLHGYSDSDWAGCADDMRSTSGYLFSFGSGIF